MQTFQGEHPSPTNPVKSAADYRLNAVTAYKLTRNSEIEWPSLINLGLLDHIVRPL